ncbi:putative glycine dehydrogenase (decarboxylating) subunit 1 [Spirochaetia bacterium]|nr:putative glycine dehydrogenase (decarboxylating) subunit 1 [Spirochaetia bacterium]
MPYIPITRTQKDEMLQTLGVASLEDLFCEIPKDFRFPLLKLDEGLGEAEVLREITALAERNLHAGKARWFLGAGCYNHFIPAAVGALASRGEFLTAYTPYQPEVSQGTLQAIFEYQSMIAELLGMDVVNAGHYDGAAALAEAVIIALKQKGGAAGQRILVPAALHPEYREVLTVYLAAYEPVIETYSGDPAAAVSGEIACLAAAYPDFFGTIPNLKGAAETAHAAGGLFIVHADPVMLGLFKSPGEYGADIVTAEGQSLGNDMNYGGPLLGIMAVTKDLMRKIPGRIVGEAKDAQGRRGFVLTLSAREQHIRRERAVSNICSNQGLSMLRSCIYLALLGKQGLRHIAELCWHRSHYAAAQIAALPGFSAAGNFFKEFTVKLPKLPAGRTQGDATAETVCSALAAKDITAGLPLSRYFPERKNELLVCVTEQNSRADIDYLVNALREFYL